MDALPAKAPLFFYCYPKNNPYFEALISRAIKHNLKHYPEARHIIYPIYGIKVYSSLKSRFPRWLKFTTSFLSYLHGESQLKRNAKESARKWLTAQEIKQIEFVGFTQWAQALLKACTFWPKSNGYYLSQNNDDFISNFRLNRIRAGDLICDTYLRYRGVPMIDMNHWFFKDIIWRSKAIEKLCQDYFTNQDSIFYFGSYSTYIDHGISLRSVCQTKKHVAVTFGSLNPSYVIHRDLESGILPSHKGYHHKYSLQKAKELPKTTIDDAEYSLKKRLNAIYDDSMTYMRRSGIYKEGTNQSANGKYILMLHDFFDSPHIYQWLLFPDFWTWAYETLDFCAENNIPVLVKPHPNQLPENEEVIETLQRVFKKYKFIHWISKDIHNSSLFKQAPQLIISGYGSVAAEATYCGIPVLLAGDHPGINFDVAKVPRSKQEYFNYLSDPSKVKAGNASDAILFTALHHKESFTKNNNYSIIKSLGLNSTSFSSSYALYCSTKSIKIIDKMVADLMPEMSQ